MSPDVRRIWPEVPTQKAQMFVIDLAPDTPFDPIVFNAEIDQLPLDKMGEKTYKWIVRGDCMIIFPNDQRHSEVNYAMEQRDDKEELKAAGYIAEGLSGWEIFGESMTLDRILSVEKSDEYKLGPLKEKLGDYFAIS